MLCSDSKKNLTQKALSINTLTHTHKYTYIIKALSRSLFKKVDGNQRCSFYSPTYGSFIDASRSTSSSEPVANSSHNLDAVVLHDLMSIVMVPDSEDDE